MGNILLAETTVTNGSSLVNALSNIDLSVIGETLTGVIGPCLGVVIPILAIRKGISFVLGMIHGA